MDGVLAGIIVVPGTVALIFLLVIGYLQRQMRGALFRAWQLAWAAYLCHFPLVALYISRDSIAALIGSRILLSAMAGLLIASTRNSVGSVRPKWRDLAFFAFGMVWAFVGSLPTTSRFAPVHFDLLIAAALLYSAWRFLQLGRERDSAGFTLLGGSLTLWSLLMCSRPFHEQLENVLGNFGHFLGPLPQVLVGVSMLLVIFECEQRLVQENALALSTLDVDTSRLLAPEDLQPATGKLLQRLMEYAHCERAVFWVAHEYRPVLPPAQHGFGPELLHVLQVSGVGQLLSEVAFRRGGLVTVRDIETTHLEWRGRDIGETLRTSLTGYGLETFTAVSVQTHDRNLGCILFPHSPRRRFGSSQLRVLLALTMQVGTTFDNYILMHETQRRTREYQLLTQLGQVVSSRLDADEVLQAIHKELGLLFDTNNFHVAFRRGDELHFEFQVIDGKTQPKHSRKLTNGLSEYIIDTGQPLLIPSDVTAARQRLGLSPAQLPATCFIGVPIFSHGRAVGMMGALTFDREFAYDERDVELLQTATGQVAISIENARLFKEQHLRSGYLAFLNNISKTAISNQNADEMLAEIVREIQTTFRFDHIGIGLLDYATKDIEIKAEAGTTAQALGKRFPLGVGVLGRVARSNELTLVQDTHEARLQGVLPESRSVLCLPLTYGQTLLGILNVESRRENAFAEQEILLMRTLADLLATALHNAFVFQKMQQQSITDGLTGVKTRRFFLEAIQSEWKRASRSGRPFSAVLIDLDKFKEVNDHMGHLEGDLVLARVGRLLEQKCRQSNVVARYGGDEFVILMPETDVEQALTLSQRLRLWLATDPMLHERRVTGSFGVATFPLHGSTVEDILRVADTSMYESKRQGGSHVSTMEELGEASTNIQERQRLAAYIEGFLQREQSGPELLPELVATLGKLCGDLSEPENVLMLMEGIRALNRAAEARESLCAGHGETVARYARIIGRGLGMSADQLSQLVFAAQVHDVGKILLPERLLNKPGLLTEEEYLLLNDHTAIGARITGMIPNSEHICEVLKYHHERLDGSGYPDGLREEEIPLFARIVGICDAFANRTVEQPFAPSRDKLDVVREMESEAGVRYDAQLMRILAAHFKAEVVDAH